MRIRIWHVLVFVLGLLLISPAPRWVAHKIMSALQTPAPLAPEQGQIEAKIPPSDESHSTSETIVTLVEKLGEALIIAVILALFVDEVVKHALVKEVTRDVLDFTFGYQLPDEVKAQIRHILRLPFARRDFEITYTIKPLPAGAGRPARIRVSSFARFKVINLTDSPKVYEFRSSIEKSTDAALESNHLVLMEIAALQFKLEEKELAAQTEDTGTYLRVSHPIRVPEESAGAIEFRTKRQAFYHENDYLVLDIHEPPCIGITIHMDAPSDFDVTASFGTYGKVESSRKGRVRTWVHPGVHLPGSHFRLSWKRTETAHADQTSNAPA